jgi:phosphoenolpyruvate synthase/pyruvate phosphate dikinase
MPNGGASPSTSPGSPRSIPEVLSLEDSGGIQGGTFGGKATMLGEMVAKGLPVLPGVAVSALAYESALERAGAAAAAARLWNDGEQTHLSGGNLDDLSTEVAQRLSVLDLSELANEVLAALGATGDFESELIVRSSATGEDSSHLSYAGQFVSQRCRADIASLKAAITAVWTSCTAPHVAVYRAAMARGNPRAVTQGSLSMGLVVQPYQRFSLAGIFFSQHPTVPLRGWALLEYLDEDPTRLVSGEILPHSCRINETSGRLVWERRIEGRPILGQEHISQLLFGSTVLKGLVSGEVDVEWGILDGSVCFLQSRPATTRP